MKKITFIILLAFTSSLISAQTIWNKRLPVVNPFPNFAKLSSDGNSYWVSSDRSFSEFNNTGDITGQATDESTNILLFWVWGAKITNPNTNVPYLLNARWANSEKKYTLSHYQPGVGILNQYAFADSLGSLPQSRGPVFLTVDDNTLLFLGQKSIRKILHQNDGTISESWVVPITFKTISAVWTGSHAVFCDPFGHFKAIDANGNLLWEKTQAFGVNSIKLLSDGIIGCGNAGTGEGLVFKLDFNGDLLWSKTLAEKKINDLSRVADGGLMLTGETDSSTWFVLKTDALANTLWTRQYEKGKGTKIEPTADGGAVVLWYVTGTNQLRLAKLDATGNTLPDSPDLAPVIERTLHTSGAKATQYPLEGLFFNGNNSGLIVPADGDASPIFITSPWIAGQDATGNLHIAATTYDNLLTTADYRAGIASGPSKDFERVWAVSREEIAQVRRDFGEDGNLDTPPPFDLLSWPAKGNPHFRQNLDFTLVTANLDSLPAPFVDYNGDGIYNLFDGDYPKLMGDRMLWWVRTDQTIHGESNGQPLHVDVLFTLYGYDCPQNGSISHSVFADYQIINRSGENYSNAYMGFFSDFDLGCDEDDYIGSLPEANSIYVYNQDQIDGNPGSTCASGAGTYGADVPVEAITILNHTMDHAIYSNRTGSPGDPTGPNEFYSYLKGLICAGQLPTIGGTGCNPGSTNFTNFVFPDNPSDVSGWSMCTANLPLGDRRMLNSHGPFNFNGGDTFNIKLAFTYHPNIPLPCPDINGLVKPSILQTQQWYNEGALDAHLDLGSVLTLTAGQSLQLNATQSNPATAYNWSTGQTTSIITVNQTGEYTVTITPATGCDYVETVLVKSASGVNTPTLPTWQVQPNPAHDVLKITFEGNAMPVTAILRNAQGQAALTKTSTENAVELSVANLPSGFYWAELWRDGLFLGSRKVVVAR